MSMTFGSLTQSRPLGSAVSTETPAALTTDRLLREGFILHHPEQHYYPYGTVRSLYKWFLDDYPRIFREPSPSGLPRHIYQLLCAGTSVPQVERPSFIDTANTEEAIRDLRNLSVGWNGYDIPEPSESAIEEALSWLESIYRELRSTQYGWRAPSVSADENGSVVLEWENGENGLAFYISGTDVHYLLDWGYDIEEEMEYGTLTDPGKISELWDRFNS